MNKRLRQLRQAFRLSQQQVADLLGISQSAYSQIEKGTVSLSVEHLKTLCSKYEVSMDWLARGSGPKNHKLVNSGFIPLVRKSELAQYIDNLHNGSFLMNLPSYSLPDFSAEERRIFEAPESGLQPFVYPGDYLICQSLSLEVSLEKEQFYICVLPNKLSIYRNTNASMLATTLFPDILELWKVDARLSSQLFTSSVEQEERVRKLEKDFHDVRNQLQKLLNSKG